MIDEVNVILGRADCSSVDELRQLIIKLEYELEAAKQKQRQREMESCSKKLETRKKWLKEIDDLIANDTVPPNSENLYAAELIRSSSQHESCSSDSESHVQIVPDCAEESLLLLLKECSRPQSMERSGCSLDYLVTKLLRQLRTENLESRAGNDIQALKKISDDFAAQKNGSFANPMELLIDSLKQGVLDRIIKAIRPLDVLYLIDNIRGTNTAAQSIKGRDIILILGCTGVGKSTLIHFLAGSKIIVTDVDGIPHWAPETIMDGLKDVMASCSSQSATTGIHAVSVNTTEKSYIICDTAGFGDTRGEEYEIASGIVMTNAIRSANSVKLTIVLDEGSMRSKFSSLRNEIVPSIVKLIPTFKQHAGSVFYLFNNTRDSMKITAAKLNKFCCDLTNDDKADKNFKAMISDLAYKCSESLTAETDLLNERHIDEPGKELLMKLDAVLPIMDPGQVFCHFASAKSISALKIQSSFHKDAIMRGLDRYEISKCREELLLLAYKLHQLRDLYSMVGIEDCKVYYAESLLKTNSFIKKIYGETYQYFEIWYKNDYESSTDPSACVQKLRAFLELERIRDLHVDHINLIKNDDEINRREGMVTLILRALEYMKESVRTHFETVTTKSDADILILMSTSLASVRLNKLKNLSCLFQTELLVADHAVLADKATLAAYKEVIQTCDDLMVEITSAAATLIDETRKSITDKTYTKGLPLLQRLAAIEMFDFEGHEHATLLQALFVQSIIDDCGEVIRVLDDDAFSSAEVLNKTFHEVLCVCSIFNDIKLIEAKKSLIAHIGQVYERMTSRFQDMIIKCDVHLFSKAKADAKAIDILRSYELVKKETNSQFQSLASAEKSLIENFLKQAIEQIVYIANMNIHDWVAAAHGTEIGIKSVTPLKDLILLITNATQGDLKNVYKRELDDLEIKISSVIKNFNDDVKKAEKNNDDLFRKQTELTSLYCKRCALLALSKISSDSNSVVPSVSSLQRCIAKGDKAVTNVAKRGLSKIITLLRTPDKAMTIIAADATFKDDVRFALLFIDSARSFGFTEVLTNTQIQEIETLSNEFPQKGWNVILPADSTAANIEITAEIVDRQIEKFLSLKGFQSLLLQDAGICTQFVKAAIDRSITLLRDRVLQLLKELETIAQKYNSNSDPSILEELLQHIALCELLARTDSDFLVDSDIKFVTVGHMLKAIVNNIGTSTKNKIAMHDYDGILDDIKKFDVKNSQINIKVDEILKAVFTALQVQEREIADRVQKFRLDTTCTKESEVLIDELCNISDKLNLFVAHVTSTQLESVKIVNDIGTGINQTMMFISKAGTACVDNIQLSLTKIYYFEAEETVAYAESMIILLENLTASMAGASEAQEHLMSQESDLDTKRGVLGGVFSSITGFFAKQSDPKESKSAQASKKVNSGKENVEAINTFKSAISSKRKAIDSELTSAACYFKKEITLKELEATPPLKLFEELKRAELKYDKESNPKYHTTAKKLQDYLILKINSLLKGASLFITKELNNESNQGEMKGFAISSKENISTLHDCELFVNSIALFTPFLSLDLFEKYQLRFEKVKSEIEYSKNAQMKRISQAIDPKSGDYDCSNGVMLFYDYHRRGDFYLMKITGDALHNLLIVFADKLIADMKAGNICSALNELVKSFSRWNDYVGTLNRWDKNPAEHSRSVERTPYNRKEKVVFNVKSSQDSFSNLIMEIKAAIGRSIAFILDGKQVPSTDTELHFDNVVFLLSKESTDILKAIIEVDRSLIERISRAILTIATSFSKHGITISQLLLEINIISCESTNALKNMKRLLAEVTDKIAISRQCKSLLDKIQIFSTSTSTSALSTKFHNEIQGLQLLSASCEVRDDDINTIIENFQKILHSNLLNNESVLTPNPSDRDTFYRKMQFSLSIMEYWDSHQSIEMGRPNEHYYEEISKIKIMKEITNIENAAKQLVEKDHSDYTMLGIYYDNLRSIKENFTCTTMTDKAIFASTEIDTLFFKKIEIMKQCGWLSDEDWYRSPFTKNLYRRVSTALINMKVMTNQIAHYKKRIDVEYIDQLLKEYKERTDGAAGTSFLWELSDDLTSIRTSDAPIAAQILEDHATFSGYKLLLRNQKVLTYTVENVLDNTTADDVDGFNKALKVDRKNRLIKINEKFEESYWKIVDTVLKTESLQTELAALVMKTKHLAARNDLPEKTKILELLVLIFAYWTLDSSKQYQEAIASANEKASSVKKSNLLLQPHAGQIVGILMMFGLDEDEEMKSKSYAPTNHVVEIATGEGKSVTLAVSAMILALLGFGVDVVCYSEYLSERDKLSFQKMFFSFGLSDSIQYGTFKFICEKFLNQRGNIREGVSSIMTSGGGAPSFPNINENLDRILLIDEVDVFFNKEFYANTYKPLAKLSGNEITALIKELWIVHKTNQKYALTLNKIKTWPLYTACVNKYAGWEFFIDESLKMLVRDLKSFDGPNHVYHVDSENSRIGYKDHDSYIYNKDYGYETMFAYFKEHEKRTVTSTSLNMKIYFLVDCGAFSYAAVPQLYTSVLGVSGTLKDLSAEERNVLRNVYGIKCATYLPSVYGKNNMTFDPNSNEAIKISSAADYYMAIVKEIEVRLKGSPKQRAVLVFFETKEKVNDFLESHEMSAWRGQVRVMREEDSVAYREQAVRQAVASKSITLLSRDFGRGTDFVCYDDELNTSGGVHVIQTFVSLEVSEQTQIKGRTARQGNKGSYSLRLLDTDLESIGITLGMIKDFESRGERYTVIDMMRKRAFNSSYADAMMDIKIIEDIHDESQTFLQALYRSDTNAVKEFIKKRNMSRINNFSGHSRTICLLDATGSMDDLLEGVKSTVKTMFERAKIILEEEKCLVTFEMQIAVYRNYNAKGEILEYSNWEQDPENLRTFLDGMEAHYGLSNEAIEIGMWHVNEELKSAPVTQVILIGDAPPNTKEQVTERRQHYYSRYWSTSEHHNVATYYEDELDKLIEAEVPVHAFYLHDAARQTFKDIAERTNGSTGFLDIKSEKGAEDLTKIVTMRILEDVNKYAGGGAAGEQRLREAYEKKHRYGFV